MPEYFLGNFNRTSNPSIGIKKRVWVNFYFMFSWVNGDEINGWKWCMAEKVSNYIAFSSFSRRFCVMEREILWRGMRYFCHAYRSALPSAISCLMASHWWARIEGLREIYERLKVSKMLLTFIQDFQGFPQASRQFLTSDIDVISGFNFFKCSRISASVHVGTGVGFGFFISRSISSFTTAELRNSSSANDDAFSGEIEL